MYTMFPASAESRTSVKKEPLRSRIQSAMEEHPRLFYLAALAGALTAPRYCWKQTKSCSKRAAGTAFCRKPPGSW